MAKKKLSAKKRKLAAIQEKNILREMQKPKIKLYEMKPIGKTIFDKITTGSYKTRVQIMNPKSVVIYKSPSELIVDITEKFQKYRRVYTEAERIVKELGQKHLMLPHLTEYPIENLRKMNEYELMKVMEAINKKYSFLESRKDAGTFLLDMQVQHERDLGERYKNAIDNNDTYREKTMNEIERSRVKIQKFIYGVKGKYER